MYGFVYRAQALNGDLVALKRLVIHKEHMGFPLCAVREIKFLKQLRHRNIVQLRDIITSKGCEQMEVACGSLYLAFEYIEHDLGGLVDAKYRFSDISLKCVMKQVFDALAFLAENRIIHRDIKCSNILISSHHYVKLADFGLARSAALPDGREGRIDMTNNVVTIWYRAPELLLGSQRYSYGIDVWSAGCVFAELARGRPLFPGKTEVEQLDLIFRTLGTPSVADLLDRIFAMDPSRRCSARTVLSSRYFMTPPLPPADPASLPPLDLAAGTSLHEFETKQRRKAKERAEKQAAPAISQDDGQDDGLIGKRKR
eukprot:GSChrysophyteH1.ASY1.ANO1.154.1 assembled CDS